MNQPIATDPPRDKQRMTEDMRKPSAHGESTSWDTEAFDAKVKTSKDGKWKGKESKKASRVQDISMSLESGHEPVKKPEESWPFDSSPCQLFGGKNTKGGGNDAMNKELFKTEFEIKKESKTDEESEDDNESEISDSDDDNDDNDDDDDDDDDKSFGEESEDFEMGAHDLTGKIDEEAEEAKAPSPSKTEKAPKKATKGKERSLTKAASSRSLESTGNRSQDRPPVRRSLRRSDSDRRLASKKSARDDLGGSCHPNIETKNNRRTVKKPSQSLSAATTHGDKPSRGTRSLQRAKSSDGLESMRSSRHGGLGSSKTSHGDEGRLRSSRKLTKSSSSSKSGDRRSRLTRAMSTKNVKPPEQYSSSRSSSKDVEVKAQDPASKKSARPGLERKISQRSMRKVADKPSGTVSKSQSRRGEESESEVETADPEAKRKQKSTSRGSSSGDKAATSEAPRRDLLVLLREQKTVQPADLMDQENRRLLHFLAFEHKMGISFKELRRSVSADA